jgi:hypothetical protein
MSTAHEHFREAERCITSAYEAGTDDVETERTLLDYAQVHATLALAAASGANRQPADKPDVRMSSPAPGDLITEQMGGMPDELPPCGDTDAGIFCHEVTGHDGPHVDEEGRDFT